VFLLYVWRQYYCKPFIFLTNTDYFYCTGLSTSYDFMKRLFAILLLTVPILCVAQKQGREYLDSLQQQETAVKEDTMRAKIEGSICNVYWAFNPDSGILYGKKGLQTAQKWGNKKVIAYIYRAMATNYRYNGDYERAGLYNDSALKLYTEIDNKEGAAGVYGNLSILKIDQSDYPAALDYAFKGLKIYEELGKKERVAASLGNISIIYSDMSNYDKALEYLQRALKMGEEANDKKGVAITLSNIGRTYTMMGKDSLALEYDFKALKAADELGNTSIALSIYSFIGTSYYNLKNYNEAITYFTKGLSLSKELKNKKAVAEQLGNLGDIYLGIAQDSIRLTNTGSATLPSKRDALYKAIDYSGEAAKVHLELHNLRDLSANYHTLAQAWEMAGDKQRALDAYKLYVDYHDSVFSKENKMKMASLEKQRELDSVKQQVKIDSLKISAQNLEASKRRNDFIFLFIGMGLLVVVTVFIARERKKSEHLLLNILPPKIAERLKNKEHPIADHFKAASIVFIDMAGFTTLAENREPKETVNILNDIFTKFDGLAEQYGLEKIKTIGDCYMAVAGLPHPVHNHAIAAANMAIHAQELMDGYKTADGVHIKFRVGLDCGPVVAGVIGKKKFVYDLWGNAVNTASRMESTGVAGEIHCTNNFKEELEKEHSHQYSFTSRGITEIKGIGVMQTWLIKAKRT